MDKMNQQQKNYYHVFSIPVKWGEMDAFLHVNNTVFLRYLEDARIALFTDMGLMGQLESAMQAPIVASITCDYIAPLTYPDTIAVGTNLTQTGPKKFIIEQAIVSQKSNKITAKAKTLCVYYDYQQLVSCAIPSHVSELIQQANASAH